jgi:L-arabinose isomerase
MTHNEVDTAADAPQANGTRRVPATLSVSPAAANAGETPALRFPKPKVGLLGLTLEFYERLVPELRPDREQWIRCSVLPALSGIADVRFPRAAYRREDVDQIVAEFESAGLDAVLVIDLSYSPSLVSVPALCRTKLPVIIWNTQELFAVDRDFSTKQMIGNHGVHGTQDLANTLLRSGTAFEYVTSHLSDPGGLQPLDDFFAAASAVRGLARCRMGLLGYPFPDMGDLAVDTAHLAATLGCQSVTLTVEDYHRRSEAAASEDVQALCAQYRESYAVAGDVALQDLEATARAELSLRSLVAEQRLDAITFQFLALGEDPRTLTLPFVGISRLMAEDVGFAGEGDLIGSAGTWLLNRLCPPASFTEIFTIDFAGNGLFLSHMGEANPAMARRDRRVPLVASPQPIVPTRGRVLMLTTCFEPGPATLCALTLGPSQRWRLIASAVDIADYGPLPVLTMPHGKITVRSDVRTWLTSYAKAGGPHHHALCVGDARPRIRLAAKLLDADYVEI